MKIHNLKTNHEVFAMSLSGDKPWEIRFNDRDYKVGDMLILEETKHSGEEMKKGKPLEYTGRKLSRIVLYILRGGSYGLAEGWVVMTVSNI